MTVRTRSRARVLGSADLDDVLLLLASDPILHVFVEHRVRATRMIPRWLGGEMWGYDEGGRLVSVCHAAANLSPVNATPAAVEAFAGRALAQGRRCGSIMGRADEVSALWQLLEPEWGPARSVRPHQPFLVLDHPPAVAGSSDVRRVSASELDLFYPACVAMYTEELGVSPEAAGGGPLYRARIAQLIAKGHAFAHIENGEVVFKAEIGPLTPHSCQVQSVWVNPAHRGTGLAPERLARVCEIAMAEVAPVVSLYVNAHNEPARRTYDSVGFVQRGTFATILF